MKQTNKILFATLLAFTLGVSACSKSGGEPTPPDPIVPTSISINGTVSEIEEEQSVTFTATVLPADAPQDVTWSSSDTTLLTITAAGVATAVAPGSVTITAACKDYPAISVTRNITVTEKDPGPGPGPDPKPEPFPYEDTDVSIRVDSQWGAAFQVVLQGFAKEFMKEHPHITVDVNHMSGTYDTVHENTKTEITAGTGEWGDLVVCYPDHVVDYIEANRAVDFDKFIYSEYEGIPLDEDDLDDYTPAALEFFKVEYPSTGTYAMPFAMSTECMFYNPVLLTLTIPGINNGERIDEDYINSLTWEEMFKEGGFCEKVLAYNESLEESKKFLNTTDDNYTVLGYDEDGNAFITLCEQYGYGYTSLDEDRNASIDFNNANVRNLMKKFNEAKNKHYILSMGSNNDKRTSELFGAGKALFCISSTGGITYQETAVAGKFDIRCARIPQAEGHDEKLIQQGGSFCILSHSDELDEARQYAAWLFYKYITNVDNNIFWSAQSGYAPIRQSVYESEEWAEVKSEEGKTGIELLTARGAVYTESVTDYFFMSPVFKGSSASRTFVDGLFAEILSATTDKCTDEWLASKFNTAENNIRNAM